MSASTPPTQVLNNPLNQASMAKSPSPSGTDWLANSLLFAKTIAAAAECAPFPYLKGVFGTVVVLLETVEKVKKNRDDLRELCLDSVGIIAIVRDQITFHGDTAAAKFKRSCQELEGFLQEVLTAVTHLRREPRGFGGRFREILKLTSVADEITGYRKRIQEFRANFVLMAGIDTNFTVNDTNFTVKQIHEALSNRSLTGWSSDVSLGQIPQGINTCPPPSRLFQGRENILDKMHQYYFIKDSSGKHIFLLYGLGGAGKTQIGLKFIERASPQSEEYSCHKNAGSTSQDALRWLKNNNKLNWLLFFDNADDRTISLHSFFPQCTHGNILITSRNPGLRTICAGAHCCVSDMELPDAVELLLNSAAEDLTPENKVTAAPIVEVLCYLPLAIIQAGAFISKSGDLAGYLALYNENQARLLSEKPDQLHDGYARTVYTTWQISFEQLSIPAATFLQLCSFLHHEGISEDLFRNASKYTFPASGPSKAELQKPLEFLSHFLGERGVWDTLRFIDITNEIRAYSLINFHSAKRMLSIHPLVHAWSQSTFTEVESFRYCMVAIVGMSFYEVPKADKELSSLKLLPHAQSLLRGAAHVTPDFGKQYGEIYSYAGKPKEAEKLKLQWLRIERIVWVMSIQTPSKWNEAKKLQVVVLEKQRLRLPAEDPDIFTAMSNLATTYHSLGQLQEAEQFGITVLEGLRKTLSEDHPETLNAMGSLATIYYSQGKLQEAKELEVRVLQQRTNLLGDEHLDTLSDMHNLAATYHDLGELDEALKLKVIVLEKRKKLLGEEHPDTLAAMGNLATTYHHQANFSDAKKLELVVLEKQKELLGDNHPHTLQAKANLESTKLAQAELNKGKTEGLTLVRKPQSNYFTERKHVWSGGW
ncbi:hypothetical protein B0H13DRAFT_2448673 [Mycena leptocephala]|nr:hypothetical protein B0H13DRAFT_2448673 [Mycena leptocephala]